MGTTAASGARAPAARAAPAKPRSIRPSVMPARTGLTPPATRHTHGGVAVVAHVTIPAGFTVICFTASLHAVLAIALPSIQTLLARHTCRRASPVACSAWDLAASAASASACTQGWRAYEEHLALVIGMPDCAQSCCASATHGPHACSWAAACAVVSSLIISRHPARPNPPSALHTAPARRAHPPGSAPLKPPAELPAAPSPTHWRAAGAAPCSR